MATAPVNLGLIGLGPWWETRFKPALQKLDERLRVVAVYDNVPSRAEHAARELSARVSGGVTILVDRLDVQALLWLDAGWQGPAILQLLCERRKPVLMAARCDAPLVELEQRHSQAASHGVPIIPAFPCRCTPASNRLQELMATQLGRPQHLEISISPANLTAIPFATESDCGGLTPAPYDPLLEWTDWCQYLFRATPQQVTWHEDRRGLRLQFAPASLASVAGEPRTAELGISASPPLTDTPTSDEVRVRCEHGKARLLGSAAIEWIFQGQTETESLATERTETEVLLDHFCRRAVGGLIPVPDLGDLVRAMRALQPSAAWNSHGHES